MGYTHHYTLATGAVLTGRRTFDAADGWDGDHHDGVHIEVFTRAEPGADAVQGPNVRFATDGIEVAMARAKSAAGDRNVLVHGAATAQLALQAGVLDELEIHQVPVLLGAGRSLFGTLGSPARSTSSASSTPQGSRTCDTAWSS